MKTTKKYGKKADLALSLWVKLARAFSTFNKLAQDDIRRYGLTQPQFGVIECLGHLGSMSIGQLSKKHLVSGGNMTCVVCHLEKSGLVERVRKSDDRRAVVVQLTEKGVRMFHEIFVEHARYITRIASILSGKEQEELSQLLKKLGLGLRGHA